MTQTPRMILGFGRVFEESRDVDDRRPGRLADLVILADFLIIMVDRVDNSNRHRILPYCNVTLLHSKHLVGSKSVNQMQIILRGHSLLNLRVFNFSGFSSGFIVAP